MGKRSWRIRKKRKYKWSIKVKRAWNLFNRLSKVYPCVSVDARGSVSFGYGDDYEDDCRD